MTDPSETLAREVLAAEKVMDDTPGLLYLDGPTHEHEEAAGAILDAAPDLAHAVIDLTDKVERMEALAANLDDAALWAIKHPDVDDDLKARAHADRDIVARIRAILNGETR